jgi:hypothetical protein
MPALHPDVSIVIVNWRTADLLRQCLQSLRRFAGNATREIIVFDNNSNDHTATVLQDFPEVRAVFHPRNIGFAAANNRAAEMAKGKYLLLLNPDTELTEASVDIALNCMRKLSADVVGVRLRLPDQRVQVSSGNFPALKTLVMQKIYAAFRRRLPRRLLAALSRISGVPVSALIDDPALWDPYQNHRVDWVSGAFFMLKRADFIGVGGFDEAFRLFGEEIDLCKRLCDAGKTVWFCGETEVRHHSGASIRQFRADSLVLHFAAMLRYYQKHRGTAETAVYRLLLCLGFGAALLRARLQRAPADVKREKIGAYRRLIQIYVSGNPDIVLPDAAAQKGETK